MRNIFNKVYAIMCILLFIADNAILAILVVGDTYYTSDFSNTIGILSIVCMLLILLLFGLSFIDNFRTLKNVDTDEYFIQIVFVLYVFYIIAHQISILYILQISGDSLISLMTIGMTYILGIFNINIIIYHRKRVYNYIQKHILT